MWNMTTPASSLTVSTSAMMVVISVSRWAGGEGDQQQLKQLPLRMDASREHHAAPVRVPFGGRISALASSDCMVAHSTMPCVPPAPVRLAPVPRRPRQVPFLLEIAQVTALLPFCIAATYT